MNKPLDMNALQTFADAVAAYEKISADREKACDPEKINEISAQINKIFRHILNTFTTRQAHRFLSEEVPPGSAMARRVGHWHLTSR